jgi:hypothetical protein
MLEHELLKLSVKDFTEQKQGLTYLSWAHAWAHALKADPSANFHVHTFDGKPYMDVNGTCMVWVGVTMGGNTRTCWLPVMNARNDPIPVEGRKYTDKYGREQIEKIDSFNVNTAIMRCLTKCLGMFGLGLNIYAGEDLPLALDEAKDEPKKEEKKAEKKEEPKPKAEKKEEPKAEKPKTSEADKERLVLLANTLIEYLSIQRTEADLKSYWKSNQELIDEIKAKLPDLFEIVRTKFSEAKEKALGKENN